MIVIRELGQLNPTLFLLYLSSLLWPQESEGTRPGALVGSRKLNQGGEKSLESFSAVWVEGSIPVSSRCVLVSLGPGSSFLVLWSLTVLSMLHRALHDGPSSILDQKEDSEKGYLSFRAPRSRNWSQVARFYNNKRKEFATKLSKDKMTSPEGG